MSNTTQEIKQTVPGSFIKPQVRINKKLALDLKPPFFLPNTPELLVDIDPSELEFFILYVSDKAQEVKARTTRRLFRRIEGKKPRKGMPHPAMHKKIHQQYLIGFEGTGSNAVATRIDVFPTHRGYGSTLPEGAKTKVDATAIINPETGEIEITDAPLQLRDNDYIRIIRALDNETELYPGKMIGDGRYEVTDVVGNRITIDVMQDTAFSSDGEKEYI